MGELAIITFSRNLEAAEKIKAFTGGEIIAYSKDAFKLAFDEYNSIIAIMAAGIAVRSIVPLIQDKWKDPAVLVVDTGLNFAIPILGGHHGGNELARKLAGIGIIPVITTATEIKGVDDDVSVLKRGGLIVGIGTNRGVSCAEVIEAITGALSEINASIDDVKYFASAKIEENEDGIIDAAAEFGKQIEFVPHEIINSIKTHSLSKAKSLGLNGVCEPAALALSDEKKLLLRKRIYGNVTIAIAR
ncbi:MAG: cobalamin biosynthesis protein [Candidatus Methanoperedenaceae archaeon]|nr:cobalamin biosynthesis protein [Candidatus Methanoperedenaceae archaeon]